MGSLEEQYEKELQKIKRKSRANVTYGKDRNGLRVANVNIRLGPDMLIAVEEYAKSENFKLDSAIMEVLEEKLVRHGFLPKWWRLRGFDK